jgi:hypothetical protein
MIHEGERRTCKMYARFPSRQVYESLRARPNCEEGRRLCRGRRGHRNLQVSVLGVRKGKRNFFIFFKDFFIDTFKPDSSQD